MLHNLGWTVPKTLRQGLSCLFCCGKEKEGCSLCCGEISFPSPQHWPHTVQLIPLSAALVASTEPCRNKVMISTWSLRAAAHTAGYGLAAQPLQLLSSSLLSTFCLIHNYNTVAQLNFFLLQLSQGVSPWYLTRSISLTLASLRDSQSSLSQFSGNHSVAACCSGFLPAALLSRFSLSFLPDSETKWSILASAVTC